MAGAMLLPPGLWVPVGSLEDLARLVARGAAFEGSLSQSERALLAAVTQSAAAVRAARSAKSAAVSVAGDAADISAASGDDITTEELAATLGIGERHARRLARGAGVDPVNPGSRPLRWPASTVESVRRRTA